MHGLKSAVLANFQKSADWLDAWQCGPPFLSIEKKMLENHFFLMNYDEVKTPSVELSCFGDSERDTNSVYKLNLNIYI